MTFLRNTCYVAGSADEVGGTPLAQTFLDERVGLYRTANGTLTAVQRNCPHRFAPLDQGQVIGDDIQCPYHGLRFAPNGACIAMPLGGEAPLRARLKVYPVVERYQLMWIWMGDPSVADPAAIPDLSYLEFPGFGWFNTYLYAEGNYQLLVDNLLDLTHAEFIRPLLASPNWAGRNRAEIRQEGNRITVDNTAENDNILPIMAQMRPDMLPVGMSRWEERWEAPSIVALIVRNTAAGEKIVIPSGYFLTPEASRTTHYIMRGGHDVGADDPVFTAQMREGITHVFRTEDVPMIEAQQRFLGYTDLLDREPASLKADAAAIRARRHLAKLIRQEALAQSAQVAAE